MRDLDEAREAAFFELFREYYDLEKNVQQQHNPENYTLDRMLPLAEAAGHPERKLKFIHVAGTKGKGSTSYYLAALLNAAGKHCGCFTSPHLDTLRERFQIDGQLASYDDLTATALRLLPEVRRRGLTPSLFELFTVLAMQLFADSGAEYVVLETGIGGTLDATNFIPNKCAAVITPVSFDHIALLGHRIEEIAAQKAGIILAGAPAIISKQPYPAAEAVLTKRAHALNAPVIRPDADDESAAQQWLPATTPDFLKDNFAAAFSTLRAIGIEPRREAFTPPVLRARFELRRSDPPVVIDAAHNGDSARRLAEAVISRWPGRHFAVVLGVVPGKDISSIIEGLKPLDAEYILTDPDTPRGSALNELQRAAAAAGLKIRAVIPKLTRSDLPAEMPLLFTGSFFTALIAEKLALQDY